jgi:hypothetical protein
LDFLPEGLDIIKTRPTEKNEENESCRKVNVCKYGCCVRFLVHDSPKESMDLVRRDPKFP